MSTQNHNTDDIVQIVDWKQIDATHYQVTVQYTDSTWGTYYFLTQDEWDRIKDTELRYEMANCN